MKAMEATFSSECPTPVSSSSTSTPNLAFQAPLAPDLGALGEPRDRHVLDAGLVPDQPAHGVALIVRLRREVRVRKALQGHLDQPRVQLQRICDNLNRFHVRAPSKLFSGQVVFQKREKVNLPIQLTCWLNIMRPDPGVKRGLPQGELLFRLGGRGKEWGGGSKEWRRESPRPAVGRFYPCRGMYSPARPKSPNR